jgi:hypothetical protein
MLITEAAARADGILLFIPAVLRREMNSGLIVDAMAADITAVLALELLCGQHGFCSSQRAGLILTGLLYISFFILKSTANGVI